MKIDEYGICYRTEQELIDSLYENQNAIIAHGITDEEDKNTYNNAQRLYGYSELTNYPDNIDTSLDLELYHQKNQSEWLMPDEYKDLDIIEFLINSCENEEEVIRIGEELLMYQDRNLIPLLRYIKYLVDTMRKEKIVWGVGRGSSTSSYVLYKLGIHKIDSMKYKLDIKEFFKD